MLRNRKHFLFLKQEYHIERTVFRTLLLGLLFMPFLVGSIAFVKEEKESHSNVCHLFVDFKDLTSVTGRTEVTGILPFSSRMVIAYNYF